MKKLLKIVGAILILFPIVLIGFLYLAFPKINPPEEIQARQDRENIERGRYLANHVSACIDCHSTRDWKRFSGPLLPESIGEGGEIFDQKIGFPGSFVAPNITPASLGTWTDGEILRAISSGISKNGRPLFPVMPHPAYGKMSKDDLLSIIAYLRNIAPIQKENEVSKPEFPFSLILRTIPQPAEFSSSPKKEDKIAYGKYLFNAAACSECHTKKDKGKPVEGMDLAGGFEFPLPNGTKIVSSNITPDKETGIGHWSEEKFVERFKSMEPPRYQPHLVKDGERQTIMPWTMYAGMTKDDLAAIFAYLQTVKPISNKI
ncbi:cytochrome C [Leptospira langatensis]|uniref:Cytochrome C n=1 Tax=Leptospira langatensis TaxID=2484983 RepID=A0A5F2A063_9LEPT|nr:cytochrome c [Leptospira langatensis]TGK04177.1 cytochrome C [Leptospira langatensis]TGL43657.1 cytochrome C [Leptospira langatensis]